MQKAIVIGSGGHSRAIVSLLLESRTYDQIHIFATEQGGSRGEVLGIGISGTFTEAFSQEYLDAHYFFAVGDNKKRQAYFAAAGQHNVSMPNLIASSAVISDTASLGQANVILHNSFIGPDSSLVDNNLVNTGAVIEHEVFIGSNNHIAPNSTVLGRVRIDNSVFVGANATILPNLMIPERTVIGAGAVLIESPDQSDNTYIGVPAKKKANR